MRDTGHTSGVVLFATAPFTGSPPPLTGSLMPNHDPRRILRVMETNLTQPATFRPASVKLVIGLFFTLFGVLAALDNFGVLDAGHYLRWWPAVLIVIGLLKLMRGGGLLVGALLIAAGSWLLGDNLGWFRVTIFDLWPLLLIGGGGAMVARSLGWPRGTDSERASGENIWAVLSNRNITNTSQTFTGGRICAFMGACTLDLTGAQIGDAPAVLELLATWGGIEIHVPEDWIVVGELMPVMGGFEMKGRPAATAEKKLIIRGLAWMGGVEIKVEQRRIS
jgi:hypothetical protein